MWRRGCRTDLVSRRAYSFFKSKILVQLLTGLLFIDNSQQVSAINTSASAQNGTKLETNNFDNFDNFTDIDDRSLNRGTVCSNPAQHYEEDLLRCVDNVCLCTYGTPESPCLHHQKELCSSCLDIFDMVNNICTKRTCHCPNGIPRDSSTCLKNNRDECQIFQSF